MRKSVVVFHLLVLVMIVVLAMKANTFVLSKSKQGQKLVEVMVVMEEMEVMEVLQVSLP